jgi:hypothetical protein
MAGLDWSLLLEALRRGATRPAREDDAFGEAVQARVRVRLGADDLARVHTAWNCHRQALMRARRGALHGAGVELDRAAVVLAAAEKDSDALALIRSSHASTWAYLHNRRRAQLSAEIALVEALAADAVLRERGYPEFELHRIQVGHNWARLAIQQGETQAAIELLVSLLEYLRGSGVWPLGVGHGNPEALRSTPAVARSGMASQLATELGLILAGRQGICLDDVLARLGGGAPGSVEAGPVDAWLAGLRARRDDDPAYGRHAARLLADGPSGSGLLWYLTVLDLLGAAGIPTPGADCYRSEALSLVRTPGRWPQSLLRRHPVTSPSTG